MQEGLKSEKKGRERLAEIVEVGASNDFLSRGYDFLITAVIIISVAVAVLETFDGIRSSYGGILDALELMSAVLFAIDYILRMATAVYVYPSESEGKSILAYVTSAAGVIDLMSFLPSLLPIFIPSGAVAFRIIRIVRIFRLFRINSYYDSLNAITEVLVQKKQQLMSSVFIILILMLASSLCMYSVEHEAQPEVFENAFSGLWWSVSTLLTIGYGDIYPVTLLGKLLSIVITFLGVGMVAIPTGIISAGFVEQYTRIQMLSESEEEVLPRSQLREIRINEGHPWSGKAVGELTLSGFAEIVAIDRADDFYLPEPEFKLLPDDLVLLKFKG